MTKFVVCEQISHLVLLELILLVLNRKIPAEYILICAFVYIYFVNSFTLVKISIFYFNPLTPGGKKKSFMLKQICI